MSNWEGWLQGEETRDLLLRFFLDFARFEYAMKTGGFGKVQNSAYQPNWERLKKVMGSTLPGGFKSAHQCIWADPPRKQVGQNNWNRIVVRDDWAFVINCVKTVRNNLFHGGKFPFDPDRDTKLIAACTALIEALVANGPETIRDQYRKAQAHMSGGT